MPHHRVRLKTLVLLDQPRKIRPKNFERLKQALNRDAHLVMGGGILAATVTVNVQGKRVIGGNQRVRALLDSGDQWISQKDITWVDLEPDSEREWGLWCALNSRDLRGRWDAKALGLVFKEEGENALEVATAFGASEATVERAFAAVSEYVGPEEPRSGSQAKDGSFENPIEDKHEFAIHLTSSEWDLIRHGIAEIRAGDGQAEWTDGRCTAAICQGWKHA